MLHIPLLRGGKPYRSMNVATLNHVRTGEPVAEVSLANSGLISRDLRNVKQHQQRLQEIPVREILEICRKAATLFGEADLPIDPVAGTTQSYDDYLKQLSSTTGMPLALCRINAEKIRFVMQNMERVLGGLTRGVDVEVLDRGFVDQDDRLLSYIREADSLGAVLPSNSPGVHSLWIPALAMKVPLVIKPGGLEPWSPFRIGQALVAAGLPAEAFGFYPTDHNGASQILLSTDRSMIFGDKGTVASWVDDPRVQIHGPGWSKVVFGADRAPHWREHLDLVSISVAENGGRACLNSSGIWMPSHGRELAEALAERLAAIPARDLDDPEARLAAFPVPEVARRISEYVDTQLQIPGAVDLTAKLRPEGRVAEVGGCTFLLPTVIWLDDPTHPLAETELLFPFATVAEVPQDELIEGIKETLVVTALTGDRAFQQELMQARNIDRLNLAEVPTSRISWDQPHEGNLFEHLYRQRAFQNAVPA
ncbi:aldehyde dehydrogenase [Acidobacteria bacterium Mor1]|nr:aldehyde dehydrogenase [Acidobacteria bacterium Mor1]